jgi:hypothetical protein
MLFLVLVYNFLISEFYGLASDLGEIHIMGDGNNGLSEQDADYSP